MYHQPILLELVWIHQQVLKFPTEEQALRKYQDVCCPITIIISCHCSYNLYVSNEL